MRRYTSYFLLIKATRLLVFEKLLSTPENGTWEKSLNVIIEMEAAE